MQSRVQCFMIEPSQWARRYLRRYAIKGDYKCDQSPLKIHEAKFELADGDLLIVQGDSGRKHFALADPTEPPKSDLRWPKACKCGYEFLDEDEWQLLFIPLYRRLDRVNGLFTLDQAPAGAMWYDLQDDGTYKQFKGPDGRRLNVMTPGGDWCIDWRASNCTMPYDNEHQCWCRHGVPPEVTVDKIGHTCAAGAGSIVRGSYHGFLRNGYLEGC
jgi:hypothetical protein